MHRERLIIATVTLILYLFSMFPVQTIVITTVCILCYFVFTHFSRISTVNRGRETRRREALAKAKTFLGYYSDIWRNLRLSNEYCFLTLSSDGYTIFGFEKSADGVPLRTFKVVKSQVHSMEEVWNMFCNVYSYNKTYDGLKEDCRTFKLVIEEKVHVSSTVKSFSSSEQKKEVKIIDINNCSEEDMTNLPGISAIMAKKAVKRREEIDGFKSVDEFFKFMRIKPNIQERLKDIIFINEIKLNNKIDRYSERSVDL